MLVQLQDPLAFKVCLSESMRFRVCITRWHQRLCPREYPCDHMLDHFGGKLEITTLWCIVYHSPQRISSTNASTTFDIYHFYRNGPITTFTIEQINLLSICTLHTTQPHAYIIRWHHWLHHHWICNLLARNTTWPLTPFFNSNQPNAHNLEGNQENEVSQNLANATGIQTVCFVWMLGERGMLENAQQIMRLPFT